MESASITATGHAAADEHHHHGPPAYHESARIDQTVLGILLFILSEIMLFASFFAAYFFIRIVTGPETWPPPGVELPVLIAGINTVVLISSSFTVHYALEAIRKGNHDGLKLGLVLTWLLGATFLFIQINEYIHIGFTPRDGAFGSIFFSLTGLHGAHVFIGLLLLTFATLRAFRGHFGPAQKDHLGVEVPGIYWHFVDIMWIIVFASIYIL
jgi:cytochrome c oxidase subunit III